MKWRPFGSSLRISRLATWLLLTVVIKTMLLGSFVLDLPEFQDTFARPGAVATAPAPSGLPDGGVRAAIRREFLPAAHAQTAPAPAPETTPASLAQKREELDRREQSLKTLEQDLNAKMENLQQMQAKIERMLADAREIRDAKLRHLIDVYSNMKAKQAAAVIETLNDDIAVKILSGMRGRQAGEILTFVKAEKAAELSEKLTKLQAPF